METKSRAEEESLVLLVEAAEDLQPICIEYPTGCHIEVVVTLIVQSAPRSIMHHAVDDEEPIAVLLVRHHLADGGHQNVNEKGAYCVSKTRTSSLNLRDMITVTRLLDSTSILDSVLIFDFYRFSSDYCQFPIGWFCFEHICHDGNSGWVP